MLVQNKKNKTEHYVTIEEWNQWKDIDGFNMQRLYNVLDSSELNIKSEKIPIKIESFQQTEQISIELELKPIEEAIESPEWEIIGHKYPLWMIEEFLQDKDLNKYIDKLINDPRKGMKKILE